MTKSSVTPLGRSLGAAVAALLIAGLAAVYLPMGSAQAESPEDGHGASVADSPERQWPQILDGTVDSGDQVGNYLVYGGTFKTLQLPAGGAKVSRPYLVAFNVDTGAILSGFKPVLNGKVSSVEAGDTPGTVFIGGTFTSVNGVATARLAKLDLATGALVKTFKSDSNGEIKTMARYGNRLFVGGTFTKLKGAARSNLAEISAATGTVNKNFTVGVTGLRNKGCRADGYCTTLSGAVVRSVRVTPDGSQLIVMHRGDKVGGQTRWGAAKIDIANSVATVSGWRTDLWDASRNNGRTDFVGIVEGDLSPDGSYFVVTNIIGNYPPLHDSVVAFPVAGNGLVEPLWVTQNFDSNYAVAISDAAVYVGGHFCWTESTGSTASPMYWPGASGNQYSCTRTSGSIYAPQTTYRYHLEALDPTTGFALPWDPQSNSKNGVNFLRVVPRGLMLGHDGTRLHNFAVGRAGFFPVTNAVADGPMTARSWSISDYADRPIRVVC